ncbi:ATP-binding cassette domain-containing protein [Paenibacillus sp. J2TS4]|uniref:ABC transporter ATP-binding protein n=1 Tax=Paenibacillus sp. J2TS4 TaxID=2807194 RepID=UPI001B19E1AF|nr:ATP-binding cassette domain-containing protein [Paenibacillus sp. J2TS4]GIP31921.1 ABC transporter ATP-binding protein [Paenibacillus sp. J2TS4]
MFHLTHVKKQILDIPELTIPANKVTCIVGKSGSGKTTLLKLLNGMISCDEGEIYFDGEPISNMDLVELRRKVVMLQQAPAIFSGNLRHNLLIGLQFSNKPMVTDDVLCSTLNIVRLSKDLEQDGEPLSGGEKQRLAMARVLLLQPPVLLLDEPTSALDEGTSHEIMEALIEQFKHRGQTVIMITHSPTVVRSFAEYIIEIDNGRLIHAGGA